MHLYLLRHAEARPVGVASASDADRPLSDRGADEAERMGKVLALADPEIALVLTSPMRRAMDTGAAIAGVFPQPPSRRVTDHLAPGLRVRALVEELLALGSDLHVVLIGHQPDMTSLLSRLITGGTGTAVAFPPGAAACVTASPMGQQLEAQLRWMVTPDLAAALLGESEPRRRS